MEEGERFPPVTTPCGATAFFNYDAGYGYICQNCLMVVGSVGAPRECRDLEER